MSEDYVESYIYNGAIRVLVNTPRNWVSKTYYEDGTGVIEYGSFDNQDTA